MGLLNINAGAPGNPLDALLNGRGLWGSSNGAIYQYGTDSTGRDTFGPGTAEDGTPLGNQDNTMIGQHDRRYGPLADAMANLGPGYIQLRSTDIGGPGGVIDPSKVKWDPVAGLVTQRSNVNAVPDTFLDKYGIFLLAAPLAAEVLAAGAAGELGAAAGEAGAAGAAGEAGGSIVGNAAMPGYAGAFDAEGMAGVPGMTAGQAGAAGTGLLSNGAPVTDLSVPAESGAPVVDHSVAAAGNNGILGNAGSWVMSHPLQAAGLLQTGYGLIHGGSKPGSSNSNSTKGGNGSTGNAKFGVPAQQFYVNPYIQAQIQRGYGQ